MRTLQAAHTMNTLRIITQKSPKGAGTQDKSLRPPAVTPEILIILICWTKKGGAVMEIYTRSTC